MILLNIQEKYLSNDLVQWTMENVILIRKKELNVAGSERVMSYQNRHVEEEAVVLIPKVQSNATTNQG